MSTETVVLTSIGMMGALGLFLLNGIRSDLKDCWSKLGNHLEDRTLHTKCGKEHE